MDGVVFRKLMMNGGLYRDSFCFDMDRRITMYIKKRVGTEWHKRPPDVVQILAWKCSAAKPLPFSQTSSDLKE